MLKATQSSSRHQYLCETLKSGSADSPRCPYFGLSPASTQCCAGYRLVTKSGGKSQVGQRQGTFWPDLFSRPRKASLDQHVFPVSLPMSNRSRPSAMAVQCPPVMVGTTSGEDILWLWESQVKKWLSDLPRASRKVRVATYDFGSTPFQHCLHSPSSTHPALQTTIPLYLDPQATAPFSPVATSHTGTISLGPRERMGNASDSRGASYEQGGEVRKSCRNVQVITDEPDRVNGPNTSSRRRNAHRSGISVMFCTSHYATMSSTSSHLAHPQTLSSHEDISPASLSLCMRQSRFSLSSPRRATTSILGRSSRNIARDSVRTTW